MEKERLLTEAELAKIEAEVAANPEYKPSTSAAAPTTTAPPGASIEEVQAGMREVARDAATPTAEPREGEAQYAEGGSLARELAKEKETAAKASTNETSLSDEKQETKAKEPGEPKPL